MKNWVPAGIKVVPVVPSTAIARRVEREGAVAVIAEGCESGGHVGELTTMALVPQVVDAVQIPVLAAAALPTGVAWRRRLCWAPRACRWERGFCAEECQIHINYKEKVLKARDIDTGVTGRRLGHPVRAFKTPLTRRMAEMEYDSTVSNEEIEKLGTGAMRKAAIDGNLEEGSFMAGQIAALVKKIQPASEIVQEMMQGAERLLSEAGKWVR